MSNTNSYILYDGPSMLDGNPIVVVATGFDDTSENDKTGGMIQTFIIRSDIEPTEAIRTGDDASVCGDCIHRGDGTGGERTCYVNVGQSVLSVYRAYKRGSYRRWSGGGAVGRKIRLGSYGDPMAAPIEVWDGFVEGADGLTGYTHQWNRSSLSRELIRRFQALCMASVDSQQEAETARALGWRTFRVGLPSDTMTRKAETLCPASEQAGRVKNCDTCLACSGRSRGFTRSIYIPAHGGFAVMANIRKRDAAVTARV
jgi:hypothetical protein